MSGTWRKKLDFWTVLIVVDHLRCQYCSFVYGQRAHVMLYPTKWLARAADMGRLIPEKKIRKKAECKQRLPETRGVGSRIHLICAALICAASGAFNRYRSVMKATLQIPPKSTRQTRVMFHEGR